METQNLLSTNHHSNVSHSEPYESQSAPKIIVKGRIPQGPVHDGITIVNLVSCYRKLGLSCIASHLPREAWLVTECCGMVCAVITWLLIFYAGFVVNGVVLSQLEEGPWKWINSLVFNSLILLAFCSHNRAMLTNPGAVERGNATKENINKLGLKHGQVVYKCPKCESIKPDRAHHCSICGRCIRKMDHHCPWVNNCVGELNQKHFVLFTLYICLVSCHSMFMAILHFVRCAQDNWASCPAYSPPAQSIFLIFLVFEGLLFGLFTAIMCGTQLCSICNDETGIEQLIGGEAAWEKTSTWVNIKSVFGHPFSWRWLSPFHSPCVTGKPQAYQYTV